MGIFVEVAQFYKQVVAALRWSGMGHVVTFPQNCRR